MFLDAVDRDTTKKYLDKDQTKCVNKDKAPLGQFHAAVMPLPRRDDTPHSVLTPLSHRADAPLMPLPHLGDAPDAPLTPQ